MRDDTNTDDSADSESVLDMKEIESEIAAGAKALSQLLHHAADDWARWSATIVGFRGLRNLAYAKAGVSDIKSWHYRQELGSLLKLKKYAIYDQIDKPTRSAMYKLMDSLEEVDDWYAGLPVPNKMKWKHPETIAKHCPSHLVQGGAGGNQPRRAARPKPKPLVTIEIERLRAVLIEVVKRLAKYEPDALDILDKVMTPAEAMLPDDDLEQI